MVLDTLIKFKTTEYVAPLPHELPGWGRCAMDIEGNNGLACLTKIKSEAWGTSMVSPLQQISAVQERRSVVESQGPATA
jgi:hypothetical protein